MSGKKISRFGKRYEERVAAASAAERAEQERLAARTPAQVAADAVTEAAYDWEMTTKLGDSLASAFQVGLREIETRRIKAQVSTRQAQGGWIESNLTVSHPVGLSGGEGWARQCTVKAHYDIARMGYALTIMNAIDCYGPKKYFVGEEVLQRNATSTDTYESWMLGACNAMYTLISDRWFKVLAAERASAANFKPSVRPQAVNDAVLQLEAMNLGIDDDAIETRVRVDEEAAAIASIKRTLGESSAQ
jgi:hypothetical protein